MNKLTPRDLFNPPPQAGEVVGDNGRHEPTRFVFRYPVPAGETLRSTVRDLRARVRRLEAGLRDACDANCVPVPKYFNPSQALSYMRQRTEQVHTIIVETLKWRPLSLPERVAKRVERLKIEARMTIEERQQSLRSW